MSVSGLLHTKRVMSHGCRGEKHAFRHGRYNLILAGAAFMPQSFLGTFSAAPLQGLRDMVDQQMNGEDLLLNFAVAAACQLPQPCLQVRSHTRHALVCLCPVTASMLGIPVACHIPDVSP